MKHLKQFMLRALLALVLVGSAFAGTGTPFAGQIVQGISDPRSYTGTQAWYDVIDLSSMRNNAGAVPSNGEGVKLISDKSGNSAVNALVLNGVAGNNGSSPDSVPLSITGDIDLRAFVALNDWTPAAADTNLISKYNVTGNQRSYQLTVSTGGNLVIRVSSDGTSGTVTTFVSSLAVGLVDFSVQWVRGTLDLSDGANSVARFYLSDDGVSWAQLGTDVTAAIITGIFDSTSLLTLGSSTAGTSALLSGLIYRAQIYDGIDGTLVFDANFTAVPKLATSFPESSSNAATVTINTTGDFGARISGARDLVQMTAAKQPVLTISPSGNFLTGDGVNDALRSALFSLPQPVSRYTAGSQTTWTSGDYLWDGAAGANTAALIQTTTTPQINLNAGSSVAANTDFTLATRAVVSEVINGASSSLGINRLTRTTGNAGAGVPNGVTLFASGAGTAANFGNGTISEHIVRSVADSDATRAAFILYLQRKWGIQ